MTVPWVVNFYVDQLVTLVDLVMVVDRDCSLISLDSLLFASISTQNN
jgi:hypothetical protein